MAYSSFAKQQAAMSRYAQTPAGREAKRRSHQRFIEKRRAMLQSETVIDARPLAQALTDWRTQ